MLAAHCPRKGGQVKEPKIRTTGLCWSSSERISESPSTSLSVNSMAGSPAWGPGALRLRTSQSRSSSVESEGVASAVESGVAVEVDTATIDSGVGVEAGGVAVGSGTAVERDAAAVGCIAAGGSPATGPCVSEDQAVSNRIDANIPSTCVPRSVPLLDRRESKVQIALSTSRRSPRKMTIHPASSTSRFSASHRTTDHSES